MKIRIETRLNDGKVEAPTSEDDVETIGFLMFLLEEELTNDSGEFLLPVGGTLTLERMS